MIIKNEEVDGLRKREYFYSNFIFECNSVSVVIIIVTKLLLLSLLLLLLLLLLFLLLLLLILLLLLSSSLVPFFYIAGKNTCNKYMQLRVWYVVTFLCIIFTHLFVYFFVMFRVLLLIGSMNYTKELKTTELTHTFGGGNTVLKYNNEVLSSMIFSPFSCFTWCFSREIAAWLKCWMILLCKLKSIGHGGQVYRYFFVSRRPFPIEYKVMLCKKFVVNLIISSSFIVVVWFLFYCHVWLPLFFKQCIISGLTVFRSWILNV